jgi:hypothetical protein
MTNKNKSVWETLSKVNVNDHTEKKNGLTYLSWAWAWGVLKDNYPDATFEKHVQPQWHAVHHGRQRLCLRAGHRDCGWD